MIYYAKDKPISNIGELPLLKRGASGKYVSFLQEMLCLNMQAQIKVDGDFGPATEAAVKYFKTHNVGYVDSIPTAHNAVVDATTWKILLSYMTWLDSLTGKNVVEIAKCHLRAKPREVNGENMGPWVRYYTRGKEGRKYPWCAGFASTVVTQSAKSRNITLKYFKYTLSCSELMENAKSSGHVIKDPVPGCLFLVKNTSHTGIVIDAVGEIIITIEGNTNDDGNREGYEVCSRYRQTKNNNYIIAL